MSAYTRIVLATLCVFNAFTLTALGAGAVFVIDGTARLIVAGCFWCAAIVLIRPLAPAAQGNRVDLTSLARPTRVATGPDASFRRPNVVRVVTDSEFFFRRRPSSLDQA